MARQKPTHQQTPNRDDHGHLSTSLPVWHDKLNHLSDSLRLSSTMFFKFAFAEASTSEAESHLRPAVGQSLRDFDLNLQALRGNLQTN